MVKEFMEYKNHDEAAKAGCFNCEAELCRYLRKGAGYPIGWFYIECDKCGMRTYYDLLSDWGNGLPKTEKALKRYNSKKVQAALEKVFKDTVDTETFEAWQELLKKEETLVREAFFADTEKSAGNTHQTCMGVPLAALEKMVKDWNKWKVEQADRKENPEDYATSLLHWVVACYKRDALHRRDEKEAREKEREYELSFRPWK